MLLQPLVENAVLHGLEHVVGKGYVHVWAHENNNLLTIRIVDNGVGASPQKIAELNAQVEAMQHMEVSEAPNQSGVGITNIARRLFLHYGSDEYSASSRKNRRGWLLKSGCPSSGRSQVHVSSSAG